MANLTTVTRGCWLVVLAAVLSASSPSISADSAALTVSATFYKASNQVDLGRWIVVAGGTTTEPLKGVNPDFEIRVLDVFGRTLVSHRARLRFVILAEPGGPIPVDRTILNVAVPFPENAAWVELVREGTVVARVSPLSKVLRDSVGIVPDQGLPDPARRKALLDVVEAFDRLLADAAYADALDKIRAIRKDAGSWIVDGYHPTPGKLELTKGELLLTIDILIERLSNVVRDRAAGQAAHG